MNKKRLGLTHASKDASWGLRIGVVLAAAALLVALFALRGDGNDGAPRPGSGPELTAEALDIYLETALDVRLGRREAREAGIKAVAWAEHPRISGALERAGWTMADYLRVEGQVTAARLEILQPGSVHDLDDPHSRPVPPEHLRLVQARLDEVVSAQAPIPG